MTYFTTTPTTLEELKKAYRKLAIQHHPDAGGTKEAMQAINNEYELLFSRVGHIHTNAEGETYEKQTSETPEYFINIINELIRFEGITIEIMGSFIWISGNTKPYKEQLKALKFRWSSNKQSWYLAPEDYKRRSRTKYSLQDIRNMYGSKEVETKPLPKLAMA
ncbi:MAG: DnaJ domain-containing protein [Defluviitaleaceae bacterium]|nr:DnaJ domain-containing protein [Defluviitaleaceae bacterium]